jgi:hypothetical protein
MTAACCQPAGTATVAGGSTGRTAARKRPSRAAVASTMVIRLSQEKLPLTSSHVWVTMMTRAAAVATG